MLLAIDLGNSQSSFGLFENEHLKTHLRFETKPTRTADEHASLLLPLLERHLEGKELNAIVICSVVPPAERELELFCQKYFRLIPDKITSQIDLGFSMNVDIPTEVGADRLANAAYAVDRLLLPAIVIDIGTATTFDVVSDKKSYEGGVIFPGVGIAFDALSVKTSRLPKVDSLFPSKAIGKNTVECIQAGVLLGYCDLMDGLIARTEKELGAKATVVLTGGTSSLFQGRLRSKTAYLPDLTLEGIRILYERNRSRSH